MIEIFEPLYAPGQELSDRGHTPYVLPDNALAPWRELRILVDLYRAGLHKGSDYCGLLSPRFGAKTNLGSDAVRAFVEANRGADVVLFNPFPHLAYLSYNVWMEGEVAHPGIRAIADEICGRVGIPWRTTDLGRCPPQLLCYSNYWVGTERFWDDFVGGVLVPIARLVEENPGDPLVLRAYELTYHRPRTAFLPFIAERALSSFLCTRPDLHVASYRLDLLPKENAPVARAMTRFLIPLVDAADASGDFTPDLFETMQLSCRLRQKEIQERHRREAADRLVDRA